MGSVVASENPRNYCLMVWLRWIGAPSQMVEIPEMNPEALKIIGAVAGIGGLSLTVLLLIFREVIRKKIYPSLTQNQAYRILNKVIILVTLVALAGIAAWVITELYRPSGQNSTDSGSLRLVDVNL